MFPSMVYTAARKRSCNSLTFWGSGGLQALSLTYPHRKKSQGVRFGDLGGQSRRCSNLFERPCIKQSHYRPGQAQRVLRKLRFPDFVTTAQDDSRLSALRTGRLYSQEIFLVFISVRGWVDPRTIMLLEGFYVNEKSTDTSGDRASDLLICSTAP